MVQGVTPPPPHFSCQPSVPPQRRRYRKANGRCRGFLSPVILSIQRVDEAVASKFVHANARNACEVQLPEARLTLVVLLHVPALQGYPPVRLVHVDRQPARGGEEDRWKSTPITSMVGIIAATATNTNTNWCVTVVVAVAFVAVSVSDFAAVAVGVAIIVYLAYFLLLLELFVILLLLLLLILAIHSTANSGSDTSQLCFRRHLHIFHHSRRSFILFTIAKCFAYSSSMAWTVRSCRMALSWSHANS